MLYCGVGELTRPILTSFVEAFPQVRLTFRELTPCCGHAELLADRIDVGLTWLPLDPEQFACKVLYTEPRVLAVNAAHRFSDATTVTGI
jgi:DNA-binding transcriptional LysR family regulator